MKSDPEPLRCLYRGPRFLMSATTATTSRADRTALAAAERDVLIQAEESLLGAVMARRDSHTAALAAGITAASFLNPSHRRTWQATTDLYVADKPVDARLVAAELGRSGDLVAVGGPGTVLSYTVTAALPGTLQGYIDVVKAAALRRHLEASLKTGQDQLAAGGIPSEVATQLTADLSSLDLERPTEALADGLRSGLLSIEQLADLPQPDPLVEDVLFSNALGVIFGKPGSAKTFAALDWALSVATGTRWQGLHVTQARVLWVAAEGAEGLHKRIWAWICDHQQGEIPPGQLVVYPAPINLFDPRQAAALASLAAEDGFGLVVIDTLARSSLGAEENSAKDMGLVVEAAESIRRASRAAVLLVHHTARNGDNPRGSSAIDGAAHTLWRTELEGDEVRLTNEKAKESARTSSIRLQLVPRVNSVVLHRATGSAEGLTDGPRQLLRVLGEIADESGAAAGVWQRSAVSDGVAERSFFRWLKGLAEQGFIANVGTEKQKRWALTDLGLTSLEES